MTVGEDQKFPTIVRLKRLAQAVGLLVFLLAAHAQGQRRDFLKVSLFGEEQMHRIIRHQLFLRQGGSFPGVHDPGAARRWIFFDDLAQLADDDAAHAPLALQRRLQLGNGFLQRFGLLQPFADVFAVDVAQLDLGNEIRLDLVDRKALHQIRDHVGLALCAADDGDGAVDVEQDFSKALQQVQLGLLFVQLEKDAPADALHAPRRPLVENLAHAHDARVARDEDVEVAGKAVAQRRELKELLHELFRVGTALEVDGKLQAAQIGLVAHVGDLAQLARLHQLRHLVDDGFHRGGVRDLVDLENVLLRQEPPAGSHFHAAAAGAVDALHLLAVVENLAPGREIGRGHGGQQIVLRVFEVRDRRFAHFGQIKAADLARHADGNAGIGRHEHVRERGRQQRRLLHRTVVIVHEIHRVAVDLTEQLRADGRELRFRITGRSIGHVARENLAEVALRVHKRREQRAVPLGKTHHGFVDRSVTVGVQTHRLSDDVGGFCASAAQQVHLIHRVQQLPVAGLEAVNLRDCAGDNDAHGVRHVVLLQRFGDGLGDHLRLQADHVGVVCFFRFLSFLSRHSF